MVVTIESISYENYLNVLALKASKELVAPNSESLAKSPIKADRFHKNKT